METTARAVLGGDPSQIENLKSIQDVKKKIQELKTAETLLSTLLKARRRR